MEIKIENKDYLEFLATIPNESIDFVCIDPPYNVLKGHKIETKIDISKLTNEVNRILKPNSFYSIFGQMPTIIDWANESLKLLNYKIDIVWAKREQSSAFAEILKTKELIYIFSKDNAKFFKTKGKFKDIKIPLIEYGLYNIESLQRHFTDLKRLAKGNKCISKRNNVRNDEYYPETTQIHDRTKHLLTECNVTDIWSFKPENKLNRNSNNTKHPTVKPIKLLERLIELCTPENATVLDCFLGSGTTAIACKNTNRNFIGCELYQDYYQIALDRLSKINSKLFY